MSNDFKTVIEGLRTGNEVYYKQLYTEHYPSVQKFIIKNSGYTNDAQDIFQDAMLVLLQKLKTDDFVLTASLKTYIIAIVKNLWFKKLRNISYYREIELSENYSSKFYCDISSSILKEKTYWEKLQTYMSKLTTHCNHLLQSIFLNNKSIRTIQKEFGYSSVHNAQNQKHKCISQLRRISSEHELGDS